MIRDHARHHGLADRHGADADAWIVAAFGRDFGEISNEELIRNQRSDGFLRAQKQLLQSGLKLRGRQDEVGEAAAAMFGMPGRKDFDEVTRQLTELRREVRALSHQVNAQQRSSTGPRAGDPVAGSENQPSTQ